MRVCSESLTVAFKVIICRAPVVMSISGVRRDTACSESLQYFAESSNGEVGYVLIIWHTTQLLRVSCSKFCQCWGINFKVGW